MVSSSQIEVFCYVIEKKMEWLIMKNVDDLETLGIMTSDVRKSAVHREVLRRRSLKMSP